MTYPCFRRYNGGKNMIRLSAGGEVLFMIKINNNLCCGCGHCSWIRFGLPLIKTADGVEYHEDPRPEDRSFVENLITECWSSAITVKN